jgi:hypothetical protein
MLEKADSTGVSRMRDYHEKRGKEVRQITKAAPKSMNYLAWPSVRPTTAWPRPIVAITLERRQSTTLPIWHTSCDLAKGVGDAFADSVPKFFRIPCPT